MAGRAIKTISRKLNLAGLCERISHVWKDFGRYVFWTNTPFSTIIRLSWAVYIFTHKTEDPRQSWSGEVFLKSIGRWMAWNQASFGITIKKSRAEHMGLNGGVSKLLLIRDPKSLPEAYWLCLDNLLFVFIWYRIGIHWLKKKICFKNFCICIFVFIQSLVFFVGRSSGTMVR